MIKNWNGAKWEHDKQNCTDEGYTTPESLSQCPFIDNHAARILLSRCFIGSGIASIGKLCRTGRLSSAAVNYERDETWLVFAHELGHLFGAGHYFDDGNGGIMDYNDQRYEGIHQFRMKEDICSGIQSSKCESSNKRPGCWESYDYDSIWYQWRQSGAYSACTPVCGDNQFKVETAECIMINIDGKSNITKIIADSNCGLESKPLGKFIKCEGDDRIACPTSMCGNELWETDEECDIALMNDDDKVNDCCIENSCTRKTSENCQRLKKQIDAAFTDSNGKLYAFQGSQYAVYSDLATKSVIGVPDVGYPKYILDSFPISAWNGNFDAAFCTRDDIVYIFKGFEYIRMDLGAINIVTGNAQIDASPKQIEIKSNDFEFGYIPQEFGDCGRIDAAFMHSINHVVIVCGSIYYEWTIGSKGFENVYRPFFSDYVIHFGDFYKNYHKLDAASYDWKQQKLRFYAADAYVDYVNGQQNGNEQKLEAMGYYGDNADCGADDCGNCAVVHNEKCYDSSYVVVIQFESEDFDRDQYESVTSIHYENNGGVFSGSNAAIFNVDSKWSIPSAFSSNFSNISVWKMSIWLHPTSINPKQEFFHILDGDGSHLIIALVANSKCPHNEQLTVSVTQDELIIFEDTECIIPVTVNEWNKLTFDACSYLVKVIVNSKMETSTVIEAEASLTLNISSWYLGTSYVGKIDYFIFQEFDGDAIEEEVAPTPGPTVQSCMFPVEFLLVSGGSFLFMSVCV